MKNISITRIIGLVAILAFCLFSTACAQMAPLGLIGTGTGTGVLVSTGSGIQAVGPVMFSAYMSTNVSIPPNVPTKAICDTVLFQSVGGVYSGTSARFTAPVTGVYYMSAYVKFSSLPTLNSWQRIIFYVNGANGSEYLQTGCAQAGQPFYFYGSQLLQLNAGDYVELYITTNDVTVNGGNGNNISSSSGGTMFSGYLLR